MPLIQKQIFQGVKYVKNCIFTQHFKFLGQLGWLITSRHTFRSSWNFQKLMKVRYTFDLRTFQVVKIFFPRWGVHKTAKKKHAKHFFQFLMLNISSIKELLQKPSETQWNITTTLPGKLKRKISWALCYKILPLKSQKCKKLLFLGVLWGPENQYGIQ